ncbi:hypothetical protein [Nostoc sp. LPT]|uniref:hypothetical protein n=1 Tax=Nostoc sp. LPT TaxID=2815387 RepID=UPI001D785B14|nr:hypothetical protein [Nostoc sp. LPT]MBN4005025.1 hypothetical protein [Nostoc sp. LPT]
MVLSNLGRVMLEQNQLEAAESYFDEMVAVRESIRAQLRELPVAQQQTFLNEIAKDYQDYARLLQVRSQYSKAQQILDLLNI